MVGISILFSLLAMVDSSASQCCVYCGRSFDSPHPFKRALAKNPEARLPRRAPRSRECEVCCLFMAHTYPAEISSKEKKLAFKKRVVEEVSFRKIFNDGRELWEQQDERGQRGQAGGFPRHRASASHVEEAGNRLTAVMGYWLTNKQYKDYFGSAIPRRKRKYNADNEMGCVVPSKSLDKDKGVPDGVFKIEVFKTNVARKETTVGNSDIREDGASASFKALSSAMTLKRKEAGDYVSINAAGEAEVKAATKDAEDGEGVPFSLVFLCRLLPAQNAASAQVMRTDSPKKRSATAKQLAKLAPRARATKSRGCRGR